VGVTEIPAAVVAELALLRAENARLLKMLELSPRQAAPPGPAQAGFFDAPPGPVHKDSPNDAKVAFFRALFAARTDIYATRIENSRTGWKGWLPAVRGGWQRGVPHEKRDYLPLTRTRFWAPARPPPCCMFTRLHTGTTATPTRPALAA
jgi:hypothetical protein